MALFPASKPCFAFDDGDFQYWNTEKVSWRINKDWRMALEEEFRFGDDASDFYYQHSDLGIAYSGLAKWFDVGLNFRLIFEENSSHWEQENRPYVNFIFKFPLADFKLSNRCRFEYRDKEDSKDGWRYRNKFTVKFPIKFTRLDIQPYIADEIFIDLEKEVLNRNRLYTGFSLKLLKNLSGEIFYLWQSSKKSGKWIDANILGTKLKLSF